MKFKGMRPLTEEEIKTCLNFITLNRRCHARDAMLLLMQCKLGFRIKEMLSLRIKDVYPHAPHTKPGESITVARQNLKGGKKKNTNVTSRTLPVPDSLVEPLIEYRKKLIAAGHRDPLDYMFPSSSTGGLLRVDSVCKSMRRMAKALKLERVCTHSCRKTFAARVYQTTNNDIMETKAALGHANVATTQNYLSWKVGEKSFEAIKNF